MDDIKGFELANKIIKPGCSIRLNAIACDIKVKGRLIGDSSIFCITRHSSSIENDSPVIRISRDSTLNGLFAMFGNIELNTSKFQFRKCVQVPEDTENQPMRKNYNELEINFIDNGDDRIYLSISSFGKYHTIKHFVTYCDAFMPYFNLSNVLIGGSGSSVKLKSVVIQQKERNISNLSERNQECCCRIL